MVGTHKNGTSLRLFADKPTPGPSQEGILHSFCDTKQFPSWEGLGVGSAPEVADGLIDGR